MCVVLFLQGLTIQAGGLGYNAFTTTKHKHILCTKFSTDLEQCYLIVGRYFLVISRQAWCFTTRSITNSFFWKPIGDQICRWTNHISRVENCFLHEISTMKSHKALCSHCQNNWMAYRWKVTSSPTWVQPVETSINHESSYLQRKNSSCRVG